MQEHFVHSAICKQIKGIQLELQGKYRLIGINRDKKQICMINNPDSKPNFSEIE